MRFRWPDFRRTGKSTFPQQDETETLNNPVSGSKNHSHREIEARRQKNKIALKSKNRASGEEAANRERQTKLLSRRWSGSVQGWSGEVPERTRASSEINNNDRDGWWRFSLALAAKQFSLRRRRQRKVLEVSATRSRGTVYFERNFGELLPSTTKNATCIFKILQSHKIRPCSWRKGLTKLFFSVFSRNRIVSVLDNEVLL